MSGRYAVLKNDGRRTVYVKEWDFFVEQGGTRDDWGKNWRVVDAEDIEDARQRYAEAVPWQNAEGRRRANWDEYFLEIASIVATRATCDRAHVGAVLVRDRNILATGYNGSVPGQPHCDDVGHDIVEGHCVRTMHAELNALAQAAKNGAQVKGAVLYSTHLPCWPCTKALISAGVSAIHFEVMYRMDERVDRTCLSSGVTLKHHYNRIRRHEKTGNLYRVHRWDVLDATNATNGRTMVLYAPIDPPKTANEPTMFVREASEFTDGRFKLPE